MNLNSEQLAALGFEEENSEALQNIMDTVFGRGGSGEAAQDALDEIFGDGGSPQDIWNFWDFTVAPCLTMSATSDVGDVITFYTRDWATGPLAIKQD